MLWEWEATFLLQGSCELAARFVVFDSDLVKNGIVYVFLFFLILLIEYRYKLLRNFTSQLS
jgi:hypothetical protein